MNDIKKPLPLGRLEPVSLRDFWQDEARHFTPWLALPENLKLLGDALGIELEFEATESRVGIFKADIVAKEVGTDDRVIVENQLQRTDHDHLGKLLTYAAGLGAKTVVWVAEQISDDHRRALDWLNEITGEMFSFFALEIELWRIGESAPAPKFNLVCRPNDWAKSLTSPDSVGEPTETRLSQLEFWSALVECGRQKGASVSFRKPRPQHWYSLAVGRSRFNLSLTAHTKLHRIGCELYIRHPKYSKKAFALLLSQKEAIEAELGPLDWQELPHRRDCRIVQYRSGDIEDRTEWPEQHAWLLERLEAFKRTFSERVRALDLGQDDERPDDVEETA
ncbi:MAG: DUF4268 domain-containing protein [Truepera sp.]|nr:DUF4268 domain-containing protein [Truepera sp.]